MMWGRQDRAEGYLLQPDGAFYVDGNFDLRLSLSSLEVATARNDRQFPESHISTEAKLNTTPSGRI